MLFFFVIATSCWAATYNAANDFEKGWAAHSNPNGVWSYGYSSGFTKSVTLYDQTLQNGVDGPNAQYWLSPQFDSDVSPAAKLNHGPAFDDGNVDFLANEFLLVAGSGGQYSDLVFTAPADGTYTIASSFRGDQYGIGTVVGVVVNGKVLFSSSVTGEAETVPFNTEVFLKAGNKVVFSVGPGSRYNNTGLSATISNVACSLADTATYDATSSTLTMKFVTYHTSPVTWNAWLTDQNTIEHLFSVAQPITVSPEAITKTAKLSKEGKVGVLSTLTTPSGGIVCSNWEQLNTGTVP